jgi:hypothetical protein
VDLKEESEGEKCIAYVFFLQRVEAKLTEEKAARVEVVNRLEELSSRIKELEAQPQVRK